MTNNIQEQKDGLDKCSSCYSGMNCPLKRLRDYCGGPFKDYDHHKQYIEDEKFRHKKES